MRDFPNIFHKQCMRGEGEGGGKGMPFVFTPDRVERRLVLPSSFFGGGQRGQLTFAEGGRSHLPQLQAK